MEHESGLMDNQADANNKSHNKKTTDLTHKSTISESIDIDLSKLEANEESLKPYTLSKQFLKIDLDKIRDIIEILEEYCFSLVQKDDINLAKTAKQRLILLKKIEKEKMMMEAKIIYSNQLELVEDKMKEDLDTYLSNSETEFKNLMERFNEQEKEMDKINKEELDLFKQNFEQMYSQLKPKPSKECLNWMKIKNYALRQNKFNKAQEANIEIEKLIDKDNIKFNENKQKKLDIEIKKIKRRHDNEKKVFEMKKNIIITEFNENKEKEINKIKKKYISKISELKNYQNFEISNFDKITKGVIKPCSRIQNIVSSATGIKEEDEEENKKENTIEENKGDDTKENKEEENLENNDKEKDIENDKENEENNEENNEEDIKQNDMEENEEENNDEEDNGEEYINKEE
jgi:hypothetical protein